MRRSSYMTLLIGLLLLSNLAFFVWSQGYLAPFGFTKKDLGEPERLARQLHPERITVVPRGTLSASHADTATTLSEPPSSAAGVSAAPKGIP